jgi:hypothetical protein
MILVRLLRFLNERAAWNDRNLKFAALAARLLCTLPMNWAQRRGSS